MTIFQIVPEEGIGQNLPSVKNTKLASGINGNIETIKIMQRVARARASHPLVRQLALNILLDYDVLSQHYINEALAIGNFVKEKVRYVRDIQGVETLHDPLTLIDQIKRGVAQGDCDDISLLIATLLLSIGHSPFYKAVKYKKGIKTYQHIYVVVFERNPGQKKKREIVLDGILKIKPIGSEVPHAVGKLYKV